MTRNLIIISIIGFLMFAGLAAAINFLATDNGLEAETMAVANQLYEAGSYQEAAQVYEQLLSQGLVNSSLYYNLGNTYLRQGDNGRAILNYQRAARLNPRDPEIKANLAVARALTASEFTPEAVSPIESLSRMSSSWLTLNEMSLIALAIWFMLGFFLFAYHQLQPGKLRTFLRYGVLLAAILFLAAGFSLGSRLHVEHTSSDAVIVDEVVTLNSDPGEGFATEFQLSSGSEVKLLGRRGPWAHLSGYNDAIEGWVPQSSIETVS